jgi:hypothetical protein
MRDILPEIVRRRIRDRYLAGIADAEAGFRFNRSDEDALTGALGHSISMLRAEIETVDDEIYRWQVSYRKIRGRGPSAPEKLLGSDGIFQIEIRDEDGSTTYRKGLPFQAKKQWTHADRKLIKQASDMLRTTGHGVVIDYSPTKYTACLAQDVLAYDGRKNDLKLASRLQPLGQLLGNEFLDCSIGRVGLYYDDSEEQFLVAEPAEHVFSTSVRRTRLLTRWG